MNVWGWIAITILGLNASWGLLLMVNRAHRDSVELEHSRLEAEREHTTKMREIAGEAARAQAGDPLRAQAILNQLGYIVMKPEEIPHYAIKVGWVVLDPQRFATLLQCIAHRTNIDGRIDDMLRAAGFNIEGRSNG